MDNFCFLRNVSDIMHYGTTPYFARFGIDFKGKRVPFGAEVAYMRLTQDAKCDRDHPFSSKTRRGIFYGYDKRPGGLWSGDYLVIDAESLDNADSIGSIRVLRVKDIVVPQYFVFPIASGSIKQPEDLRLVFKGEGDKLSSTAGSHEQLEVSISGNASSSDALGADVPPPPDPPACLPPIDDQPGVERKSYRRDNKLQIFKACLLYTSDAADE